MKQTLKNTLGISLIAIYFYVLLSLLTFAQAAGLLLSVPNANEPLDNTPQYNTQRMVQQQIPVFCGDSNFMPVSYTHLTLPTKA